MTTSGGQIDAPSATAASTGGPSAAPARADRPTPPDPPPRLEIRVDAQVADHPAAPRPLSPAEALHLAEHGPADPDRGERPRSSEHRADDATPTPDPDPPARRPDEDPER